MKRFVSGVGKNQRFSNDRDELEGFVFDRYLFNASFVLLMIFVLFAGLSYFSADFHFYLSCNTRGVDGWTNEGAGVCENPFYLSCPSVVEKEASYLCQPEFLPVGEYGVKPSFWFVWLVPFVLLLFGITILINYLRYNKGDKFER